MLRRVSAVFLFVICLSSCTPPPPTLDLPVDSPSDKSTEYGKALERFGDLLSMYYYRLGEPYTIYVSSKSFHDKTGTHDYSHGEIPKEMTDMVVSALNRIGPNVRYVVTDYDYVISQRDVYGLMKRYAPNVVFDGGLTEFDRALSSKGGETGVNTSIGGGANSFDLDASFTNNQGMSRITIDMNLIDFGKQLYIPNMQATNTIKVYKGQSSYDVGFAIFGTGVGGGGSAKALQGRHAALRLLIDFSVLELLGRYKALPYWRCVEGGKRDEYVIKIRKNKFIQYSAENKIMWIQWYLMYHGYLDVRPTKILDQVTKDALNDFMKKNHFVTENYLDPDLYIILFETIPIDVAMAHKVELLNQEYENKIKVAKDIAVNTKAKKSKPATRKAKKAAPKPAKENNEDLDSAEDFFNSF